MGFSYRFRSHDTGSIGAGVNGPKAKGGWAPCNSPISDGMGKDYNCTQKRDFHSPHCCPY